MDFILFLIISFKIFNLNATNNKKDTIAECGTLNFVSFNNSTVFVLSNSHYLSVPELLPPNYNIKLNNLFVQIDELCNPVQLDALKIQSFSINLWFYTNDKNLNFKIHVTNETKPIRCIKDKFDIFLTVLNPLDYDTIDGKKSLDYALFNSVTFYNGNKEVVKKYENKKKFDFWINIADDDDLNPKFEYNSYYYAYILEGTNRTIEKIIKNQFVQETIVVNSFYENKENLFDIKPKVRVFDQDFGINSSISITVISDDNSMNGVFSWNNEKAMLSLLEPLDIEKADFIHLILKATQNDNLNRQAQANLIVKVIDVNNHKPEILKSQYDINLQEHTPNGTIIGKIDAFDQDRENNEIVYEIVYDETNNFTEIIEINSLNGFLSVKNSDLLDREYYEEIYFQVVARETLTMEKYVSEPATVRLILADLNDFNPSFESSSYICDINPFDKNFHLNKAIDVIDFDANSEIEFEIVQIFSTEKNISELIFFNSSSSNFYLKINENDEIPKVITLLVRIKDSAKEDRREDHAILFIHFNSSFTNSFCKAADIKDKLDDNNATRKSNPKIKKKSFISNKEQLKSFEAIWITFMSILVLLLLIALIALIVKIGTREKKREKDDTFYVTFHNQQRQQQGYPQNNKLIKCFYKNKLSSNKIDPEIITESKSVSSKRAFSIQGDSQSYDGKKREADSTSI